ncbi:DNA repair protein RadA [Humibacter ginsenosidimutans]|uniref:DNA repair protein RadA n=1 Tax=Humibacter ginsenosidimutans TaxID=2599293 RepID=A0A5B8M474_9MICO|nr:DNA repair protein RadA [Humibacter ginsenosidimutans]QDZ15113.1 DNA repair protein RadA [Humibacter ginsenosidimutans]
MAKTQGGYRCTVCGWTTAKWVGRCGDCQAWDTMTEVLQASTRLTPTRIADDRAATPITKISTDAVFHWPSGITEFDRVLGGGVVPGAAILLSGEPGVGKSTLLLEVASRAAAAKSRVLYVSAEESAGQVRLRAERTGALHENLYLAAETDLAAVVGQIDAIDPQLVIVDSVQTIASSAVDGLAGGPSQVREVATTLIRVAKERNLPVLLVGHVTKDGQVAGPRTLEHLVDVVCQFEGDRQTALRFVRALKNRFGPTDEVGCFEMSGDGIAEVPDPSGLFLSRSSAAVSGTCVTVAMEGRRAIPVEVQALVIDTSAPNPRRVTSGVDAARLAMLLAVLEKRAGIRVSDKDVYVSTVGGVRLTEPAADLAIAVAVASAVRDRAIAHNVVAFGEISLAGEVRAVAAARQRAGEAARMGFREVIDGEAGGIGEALRLAFATGLSARERELDAAF